MRRMNGIDGLRQCQHFYCVSCVTKPLLFLRSLNFQQSLLDPVPLFFVDVLHERGQRRLWLMLEL